MPRKDPEAAREYRRALYQKRKAANGGKPLLNSRTAKRLRLAGRPKPSHCEVCGDGGEIVWDHDHSTGLFRGWICKPCNSALGFVKDNSEKLRKLSMYIEFADRPKGSV